jgi:hypothetical protein
MFNGAGGGAPRLKKLMTVSHEEPVEAQEVFRFFPQILGSCPVFKVHGPCRPIGCDMICANPDPEVLGNRPDGHDRVVAEINRHFQPLGLLVMDVHPCDWSLRSRLVPGVNSIK